MTEISLCFEVHQPHRLRGDFFWGGKGLSRADDLEELYFNTGENRRIFESIATKCYLPVNAIILKELEWFSEEERPFKVAYSLSGIFVEQCRRFCPRVLDSFRKLVDTGLVEILDQTYYHSLTSLYEDKAEFLEQVRMHREMVWDIFGVRPEVFENTELIYDDSIASLVEAMGYRGTFTEGIMVDPGYVYRPAGCRDLKLLLRNYRLTDDIGFRFSSRDWEEYPLFADKYAAWLATTPAQVINLFMDYETFGEHQWAETGILEFLSCLPSEVLALEDLSFSTPTEICRLAPKSQVSVKDTVSWADLERDTSCWLGNTLQLACYGYHRRLQGPAFEAGGKMVEIWRWLGLSDHLYYLFNLGGGPGEVHSYFSPYRDAYDAGVTYLSVLQDFHYRLKQALIMADQPFRFSLGFDDYTGHEAWSLEGLLKVLPQVPGESLDHHARNNHLANWVRDSIYDGELAAKLEAISELRGEDLRRRMISLVEARLKKMGRR